MDSDVQRETKADCKKITHCRGKTQGEFDIIFSPATSNIAGLAVYTLTADKYVTHHSDPDIAYKDLVFFDL